MVPLDLKRVLMGLLGLGLKAFGFRVWAPELLGVAVRKPRNLQCRVLQFTFWQQRA